ncbi:NXPH4 isoform 2 [Pan troglodytes]|uniref:NXPH4 isoform 2 n=1 Tax=Pan troglodytes TaxID=9598 RepID=A0A2J8KWE0_PANTR|nr:NXPH4 isoform 2 [Pan troglodytes]
MRLLPEWFLLLFGPWLLRKPRPGLSLPSARSWEHPA